MGKQTENGGEKEGVSVSLSKEITGGRDSSTGRWLPGVSGNPKGRPGKAWETANLDALMNAFTPEEKQAALRDALRIAKEQNSARGVVAVFQYIDDRVSGRPTVHIQQSEGGLSSVLDELGE